jgi:hypothetical protein
MASIIENIMHKVSKGWEALGEASEDAGEGGEELEEGSEVDSVQGARGLG